MAFTKNEYKNIPSDGIIPDDRVPADQISFGYTFTYETYANFDSFFVPPLKGHIVLELKDSAGNLKATFDLQETYTISVPQPSPGLVLYTWAWDGGAEQFSATDANGEPITTEGKVSLGTLPPTDSDSSTGVVIIKEATFYSYTFNFDVDEGDTLKIKFHNLSAGTVTDKASLLVATRLRDATTPALVDDRRGEQMRVVVDKKQTRAVRSRRLTSPVPLDKTEGASGSDGLVYDGRLSKPQLDPAAAASYYVLGTSANKLLLFRSDDNGKTWKQLMSQPTQLKILAARLARGGRYIVYGVGDDKKAAYAILKHGAGGWTLSESGPCKLTPTPTPPATTPSNPSNTTPSTPATVTELPISKVNSLEDGVGGLLRLLSTDKDGAQRIHLSRDGKTWQQAPAT